MVLWDSYKLQIPDSSLYTQCRGLVGLLCQFVGLVTGLSLFMRPFLGKLPSYSCFYINQKYGPHYTVVWRPKIFFFADCYSAEKAETKGIGNWWTGLGQLPYLGKINILVTVKAFSTILLIHFYWPISASLCFAIVLSFLDVVLFLDKQIRITKAK